MNDFLLQKSPARGAVYHRPPGIWFSEELRRWMVTSPQLVRQAMNDPAFSVPSYDVSAVTDRLNVSLPYLNEVRAWFPIATEGPRHRELREKMARHIARNTAPALASLSEVLAEKRQELLAIPAGQDFCLYAGVLRPALLASLVTLAGLAVPLAWKIEELPLLFDVRLPLKVRRRLEDVMRNIVEGQPDGLSAEERHLRAAILTLSVNTIVGSVSLTIVDELKRHPGQSLAQVAWPEDLVRTGLPIIEKVATSPATLGGQQIAPGQGVRLFIESEGVSPEGEHSFSEVFFAVGPHKCLGMSYSKQVWTLFRSFLAGIDRPLRITELRERPNDYVFNFPTLVASQFDA